ncbi:Trypsin [Lentzea waywayandensis]|uniref:Trypsin n=1 Tax=Lentzea waywayandensis TaxID=84724 RepID=A0A1I6FGL3_9PSEU|nr:trypsin-like serine protease [Lentzea waywayandensis]SFR29080.1 Trypsin [Lentzea waywayandensis]
MTALSDHLAATAELARSIAGADDAKFAVVYHSLANQVASLSEGDLGRNVAQVRDQLVAARQDNRRAAVGDDDDAEASVLFDRVYLENLSAAGESKAFIVGGEPTADFPECVAVGATNRWCCSGILVAPNVVVTAAHCIGACSSRVFFGTDVRFPKDGRIVNVSQSVKHPGYDKRVNDIAVLILSEPVTDVEPRKMAQAPPAVPSVRLAGYGNTDTAGRRGYGQRRRVDVPMASQDPRFGADPALEFVAGSPMLDRDSCTGDSGGPAYVWSGQEWLLAGVTSRATASSVRPCGDGGIYSRVDVHAAWVRSVPGGLW